MKPSAYKWQFYKTCGLTQVLFRNGEDFRRLPELDQKLWVAIGVPLKHLCFDQRSLKLIDVDGDGHIRPPEMLDAMKWCTSLLKDPDVLLKDTGTLRIDNIDDSTPEGASILAGAKGILENLGKAEAAEITLDDVADRARIFAQTRFNGDSIVPESAAGDDAIKATIHDIIATVGGEDDRSGQPGVSQAKLDAFFAAAEAFAAWNDRATSEAASIMPLGDATAAAASAIDAVRAKADDFFARCRLAAFDDRAADALNRDVAVFAALADKELTDSNADIAALPLARVSADGALPLGGGANPAWAGRLAALRDSAVIPLLGDSCAASITEAQWHDLCAKIAPFIAWRDGKAGTEVEALGLPRIREILASGHRTQIADLIAKDSTFNCENEQIQKVEKLLLFVKDLNRLANNFVSFGDYYDPKYPEIFRAGRLHLDARTSDLCVYVDDAGAHSGLAARSNICLVYCDITRPGIGTRKTICAPFTAGFAESLSVGRNGIFYDRAGNDWDAVVTKIVDHPISLREAFWSPWKKIGKMIGDQVAKLLNDKQDAALAVAATNVEKTATAAAAPTAAAAASAAPAKTGMEGVAMASSVAAMGVAVGLVGSAVGGIVSLVTGIPLWKTLAGICGVILAVSGPSMILTYFKLRARDLTPVLNASGWAINTKLPMTMRLGAEFTKEAAIPLGSSLKLSDPYKDSNLGRIIFWVVVGLAIATFAGYKTVEKFQDRPWAQKVRFWAPAPAEEAVAEDAAANAAGTAAGAAEALAEPAAAAAQD